jgi:histidinol-phosphate aminotransferase
MNIRPRRALLNPALQRPSALNSVPRNQNQLWLDKNENLDPQMMALSRDVLASIPPLALATYPEAGELYRKLATWVAVSPESLLLTPGSDGAIRLAFEAFVDTGDWVIQTSPTFAMYPVYGQMFGANVHEILYGQTDRGPSLDVSAVIESVRRLKPKLVCLPNPDSPTGTVLAPSVLREVLTECEAVGSVLLLDEAYYPFYAWSAVPWTPTSENLVVARTFAKAWGAAGMRIGYAVGHPATISLLHKMRPMYEVSTLAVEFMSRMLDKTAEMADAVARIQAGKVFFVEAMRALGFGVLPTEGNFVHVAFGKAAPDVHEQLKGKVLYRAAFAQPCLAGYSRFTVAPRPIMTGVVDLITRAVEKINK